MTGWDIIMALLTTNEESRIYSQHYHRHEAGLLGSLAEWLNMLLFFMLVACLEKETMY